MYQPGFKKALLVLVLSALTALGGCGSGGSAGAGSLAPDLVTKLDALMRRYQSTTKTPGLMVGVWTPGGAYLKAIGTADLADNAPMTTDMQYRIGSQTKVFVATLVLQLAGEGKLLLDDPVSKWIAGVPNGGQITIRELLNHTSGLDDVLKSKTIEALLPTGCTPDQLLAAGALLPVVGPPGGPWSYSNYGYVLLGRIAELAGGGPLADLIQQRIVAPLGLRRTVLPATGNGLTDPFAHGYFVATGNLGATPTPEDDLTFLPASCLWAAGGMVSTADDMRTWVQAMATGKLLSPAIYQQMLANPVAMHTSTLGHGTTTWGLGPIILGDFVGHQGGLPGFETAAYHDAKDGTTIVVFANLQFNSVPPNAFIEAIALTVLGPGHGLTQTVDQAMTPLTMADLSHAATEE